MKLHEILTTSSLPSEEHRIPKRFFKKVVRRKLCPECGENLIKVVKKMKVKKKKLKICPYCGEALIKWQQ